MYIAYGVKDSSKEMKRLDMRSGSEDRELLHLLSHGPDLQHTGAWWAGGLETQCMPQRKCGGEESEGLPIALFFLRMPNLEFNVYSLYSYVSTTNHTYCKRSGGHTWQGPELLTGIVTSAHLCYFTAVIMSTGLVSFSSGDALTSLCVQVSWLAGSSPSRIIESIS